MIRITRLKLPLTHTEQELVAAAADLLRVPPEKILSYRIVKRSVDARKKPHIFYIYTLDVEAARERQTLRRVRDPRIFLAEEKKYHFPEPGEEQMKYPPVIVGCGPAGLFCGYLLARAGYCPVILEQGDDVDSRRRKVERFWQGGEPDARTNVQFGEGGAGTFSDGKLNTSVKDPSGRNGEVLRILAEHGADPSILYENRPHMGTDVLGGVVKNIRNHIAEPGGRVVFGAKVTDLEIENGRVRGVWISCSDMAAETSVKGLGADGGTGKEWQNRYFLPAEQVILAVGHSARDTFSMLLEKGVPMQPKSFAVGLRIQHPQKMIDESQYGFSGRNLPGPADYRVAHQAGNGRGVYSFCMCPGGYVINASSERGYLTVNGMSNRDRGGQNANSALIVTVTPEDFQRETARQDLPDGTVYQGPAVLAGVEYQRRLERLAFLYGGGKIPAQLYGDFKAGRESRDWGDVSPAFLGGARFANLRETLPAYISDSIIEGVEAFEGKIRGFSRYDGILAGVESRTSSPVRILRDERLESEVKGLFPCGEGAGYAGGIMSAAMDGMKVAEEIAGRYRPA